MTLKILYNYIKNIHKYFYFQEEDFIMYPSISICKKYAFDNANLNFFDYDYMDIDKAVEWIAQYSWSLEDTVYFFTQPGVLNKTFPCTTTLGGGASN